MFHLDQSKFFLTGNVLNSHHVYDSLQLCGERKNAGKHDLSTFSTVFNYLSKPSLIVCSTSDFLAASIFIMNELKILHCRKGFINFLAHFLQTTVDEPLTSIETLDNDSEVMFKT